ncbi:MAG: hypothetical protein AAFQ43_15535 [Bacteroidota bacterium]
MIRSLFLALALTLLALPASAQGFWAEPDDDWRPTDGPPVLAGGGFVEAAETVGETMRTMHTDDPGYWVVWKLATEFSPHIPVDPNCPPPNGCPEDPTPPRGDDPPSGGENPPGGGETPPGGGEDPPGGGETPPGGGENPPATGGETPQGGGEAQASSAPPVSTDGYSTYRLGGRAEALALRAQVDQLSEGTFLGSQGQAAQQPARQRRTTQRRRTPQRSAQRRAAPGRASQERVRLVSMREVDRSDRAEYQLRFEIVRDGQAVPVLVQAEQGHVIARVKAQPQRQRQQRRQRGRRGGSNGG